MLLLTRITRSLFILATLFALAACGGGGTGSPLDNNTGGGTGTGTDTGDTTDTGTDTTTSGIELSVQLYNEAVDLADLAGSTVINTVNAVNAGILVIQATSSTTGNPVANAIVQVETDIGILVPSSGRVLTNTSGVATVTVTADEDSETGAGTLTATLEDGVATRNFQVGTAPLQLGRDANGYVDVVTNLNFVASEITVGNASISSNGSSSLFVVVADQAGSVYTPPLTINFSSPCALSGDATLDTGVTTSNGIAVATYEANGCSGTDTVTANIDGVSGVSASGSISITDSIANSIKFISANPESIAIQGTGGGGRQENSTLTFQVVDENGAPKEGVPVSFALSTTTGGVGLAGDLDGDGDMDGAEQKNTNGSGNVTVTVNSGTAVTPVRVTASFVADSGDTISIVSDALTISTGLPDQNSFSLSASVLNPGGWDVNGIESTLTIHAGDAFENPVPDGTVINFTTEYGRISNPNVSPPSASCQTTNGVCTVVWNSQSPKMPNFSSTGTPLVVGVDGCPDAGGASVPCTSFLTSPLPDTTDGQIFGGRSTVLAYALGEESFIDANGNGFYDYNDANGNGAYDVGETLEPFTDLPEAYIDHNDDQVFGGATTTGGCTSDTGGICAGWEEGGAEEEHIDRFVNSEYDPGNGIYNGALCSAELAALNLCSTDLITVRDQLELIVGGSTAIVAVYDGTGTYLPNPDVDVTGLGNLTRQIVISDRFNGYLPAGTTISVNVNNCRMFGLEQYEIGSTNAYGPFSFSVSFAEDPAVNQSVDSVEITIEPPEGVGGVPVFSSFLCTDVD